MSWTFFSNDVCGQKEDKKKEKSKQKAQLLQPTEEVLTLLGYRFVYFTCFKEGTVWKGLGSPVTPPTVL